MRGAKRPLIPNLGLGAVAHPHGHGDLRRVAHEPQVAGLVGGARLAGHRLVHAGLSLGCGAVGHDALEYVRHCSGHLGGDCLRVGRRVGVQGVAVAVEDLGDAGGVVVDAAGGEGAVGRGHLKRADAGGAQRQRVVGVVAQVGGDAHGVGRVDDALHTDLVDDLGVHGVARDVGRLAQADGAVALVLEVRDLPVAHGDVVAAVGQHRGVHTCLDGRRQGEHLERGAGLASCHRGEVELVGVVVAPADHRQDVAGGGVDAHERRLKPVVGVLQHALNGVLGGILVLGADGGLDGEAALEDEVGGELLAELGLHVVDEVGVGIGARLLGGGVVEHELAGHGLVVLLLGDVALVEHMGQDHVTALHGAVGVREGVVVGGRLGKACQGGGLGDGEFGAGLAEVGLGGGLDAVAARSVVDGVEIHHEYLVF